MRHAVIELEEGTLCLTIADCTRTTLDVEHCSRTPLRDLQRTTIAAALEQATRDLAFDLQEHGVHVVLGERRFHHFTADLPRLGPQDVRSFVTREAHRIGSMSADADLLAHARQTRKLYGRRQRVATVALASQVWEPIAEAFADARLDVKSLTSIEDAIANAIPAQMPMRTAVLEISSNKARFVVCEDRAVVRERRFMLPTSSEDDEAEMLTAQLMIELPRTLDHLAEIGCPLPSGILVSHRVPVETSVLRELFDDGLERIQRYELPPRSKLGKRANAAAPRVARDLPGLATFGLLQRLAQHGGKPSLSILGGVGVTLPRSPLRLVAAIAAFMIGIAGATGSYIETARLNGVRGERIALESSIQRLERDLMELRSATDSEAPISVEQIALLELLDTRRPHSLLLADLASTAADDVRFEQIEIRGDDSVVISGLANGANRLASLGRLADFTRRVRTIRYVVTDGRESIQHVNGSDTAIRFGVRLLWRIP